MTDQQHPSPFLCDPQYLRNHLLHLKKAIPAIPDRHGWTIVQNIIVWQYLSYADGIRDPPERRYCLVEQLETMEDQGSNDVVIGVGQAARSGT